MPSKHTTLVSFLGRGDTRNPESPYRETEYEFSFDPGPPYFRSCTTVFSAALFDWLTRHKKLSIDRWLVLGTTGSLWSELFRVARPNEVLHDTTDYTIIKQAGVSEKIDKSDLQKWQEFLQPGFQARGLQTQLRFTLIDKGLTRQSQQEICEALLEHIPHGEAETDVFFDVSNAFRHLPIIAAFAIALMRRTHPIRNVAFYSGVFEATDPGTKRTPVVELPICRQLLEATEAAAVLNDTGNYAPLVDRLGPPDVAQQAHEVWFLESTNQIASAYKQAKSLSNQLRTTGRSALEQPLADQVRASLNWCAGGKLAERFATRARQAIDHEDYFQAVILTHEAFLVSAIQKFDPQAHPMNYDTRDKVGRHIRQHLSSTGIQSKDRNTHKILNQVRNTCAHGSQATSPVAQGVLKDRHKFTQLIADALDFLKNRWPDILKQIPPVP